MINVADMQLTTGLFVFFLVLDRTFCQSGVSKSDLGILYKAFVSELSYFEREVDRLDSDAVLGLRIADAYTRRILEDAERGKIKLKSDVYKNVTDILNRVTFILGKILLRVQANDPFFYPALNSQWTYYKPYQFRQQVDVAEKQTLSPDEEERFPVCVREIVGSRNRKACAISHDCKETMMTKGASNTALYYQAMYFVLGEISGCLSTITSTLRISKKDLSDHLQEICAASYHSVMWLNFRESGDPDGLMMILRLSFSCGLLGYHEILEDRGLSNAVWWQLRSGCYGDYTRVGEAKKQDDVAASKKELKSYLGDGCFSDVTGVGLGLLAVYLRKEGDEFLSVDMHIDC
ncbi:UPF0764 protein C16orf89 homolog isoform X3 [Acropora palmata]|uniref:UPF0764 protein C16orf89 homolog isoform X3 n=1 Tax=Acropora palmata TaxID=6131 RepID=UPI003DA17FA3